MRLPRIDKSLATFGSLTMIVFGAMKLLASEAEVRLFTDIASFAGFEGLWFMYMTGAMEVSVGLGLLSCHLAAAPWRSPPSLLFMVSTMGLAGTMSGALMTEFLLRPGDAIALKALGGALCLIGAVLTLRQGQRWIVNTDAASDAP